MSQAAGPRIKPASWLQLLPRLSLVFAITGLVFVPVAIVSSAAREPNLGLGEDYAELAQAVNGPGIYRLFALLDGTFWLTTGASFLTLAGVLWRHAPRRSAFIAALAVLQSVGAFGGFMRLNGVSDLASRYASATPARQIVLQASFLDLERVIGSIFLLGDLLIALACGLIAWAAFSLAGFPRWLSAWFLIPGVAQFTLFVVTAAGGPLLFPVLLLSILSFIGLLIAMSVVLWRPSPALASAVT